MNPSRVLSLLDEIKKTRPLREKSGYQNGDRSQKYVDALAQVECPGLTARRARSDREIGVQRDPIVLSHGEGAFLWDADNLPYVDMGACFAVAAYGHANPELIQTLNEQAAKLMHGMGDVYPTDIKIDFLKELAKIAPGNLSGALLSQSGAEAVESAMKMAEIATKRHRFIAFESCYHGLSYGALSVTAHQNEFKKPFISRICQQTTYVPYANCKRCAFCQSPDSCQFACIRHIDRLLSAPAGGATDTAAIIAEPIQGRGGDVVPPKGWLTELKKLCEKHHILLILDEIYTGFGRTGAMFACQHENVVPDIICLGKALTGAFPLSAALASPDVIAHWKLNTAEAIHTSTFLGNPMGCALGLKALEILQRDHLPQRAQIEGEFLLAEFKKLQNKYPQIIADARGIGLMLGLEMADEKMNPLTNLALDIVDRLRNKGFILLTSGPWGHVVSIAPPLIIPHECLVAFIDALDQTLADVLNDAQNNRL